MPKNHPLSLLKQNIASGLVVFLVALPLCLGIALASDAPPISGIISGIIGGIVIGWLSTSHISVSGPAAGLVSIVVATIAQLGSFELFLCAGIVAGIFQLFLGFIRAGRVAKYIPIAVIEGMLAGIGILIIFKQLPYVLGTNGLTFNEISAAFHFGAFLIASASILIMLGWDFSLRLKVIKLLPSALIAVISGVFINDYFMLFAPDLTIPATQLVQLPKVNSLQDLNHLIIFPDFNGFLQSTVWIAGITIAIVASIETLLSIEVADRLDIQHRSTNSNKELQAQGIGNILSAMIGGLPITSVIIRSSANANAGATHKLSAIIHGTLLFVCVLLIPSLLNQIPLATLSAVLILVGYKLARPAVFQHFWRKGIAQFTPFMITMFAVVFLDLLKGVALGLVVHFIFFLYRNLKQLSPLQRARLKKRYLRFSKKYKSWK